MNKFAIGHMATRARKLAVPAIAGISALATSAFAVVPTEVATELGNAKTDGVSVATLVLVAVIALFAFKFMRKGL
ncbi:Bacteriophage coat protein B [compost metagenome]